MVDEPPAWAMERAHKLESEDERPWDEDFLLALALEFVAVRREAIEEAALIIRKRACGYMSLPKDAIFNAGLIVEDLSRQEQKIRALADK